MFRRAFAVLLFASLAVGACATADPAQTNRNRLAAAVSSYGILQSAALAYLSRPACPTGSGITVSNICRNEGLSATIRTVDKATTRYIDNANTALASAPAASTTSALVDAAVGSVSAFDKVIAETKTTP